MSWVQEREELGRGILCSLYDEGMIRTWYRHNPKGWMLVSGMWSPFYIQLRPLCSYPHLLRRVGTAMGRMIRQEASEVNKVVGVAMAGIPIAAAIAICEGIPAVYTRKSEGLPNLKGEYGEHSLVEGELWEGDILIIVDDLVTKFDSKLITLEQIECEVKRRGLSAVTCREIAVLFDREQGASEAAEKYGLALHSLIPFKSKGLDWLGGRITVEEQRVIADYLEEPGKYQNPELQRELSSIHL